MLAVGEGGIAEMAHRNWKDVRAERITTPEAEARVAALKEEVRAEQRAYRLAEVRRQQGMTQLELADSLNISQAAVSSIERGELSRSELSTIRRYVEALGGKIEIVADFGDQRLILG
jgi:DNA-binding XRE family transcriptional regulator